MSEESEDPLVEPIVVDYGNDDFNKELNSMLDLPSNQEASESEDEPAPLPPPVDFDDDEDDDEDDFEVPAPVLKKVAPPPAAASSSPSSVSGSGAAGASHDKSGLFAAASKGDLKSVKAILKEGKVPLDYQKRKEPRGWSALHFAVQAGQTDIVSFLLSAGADVNLIDAREKTV